VRDTGMPASHYACQSPLNKIGLFLHVTCLPDGVPLGSPTPQLKNRMGLGGLNSAGFPQIFRPFKGIICGDISEFESSHPSHAVGLSQVRSPAIVRGSLLHAFLEASGIRIDVEDAVPIEHHEFAVLRPARLRVPRRRGAACKDDECRTAGPLIVILILSNSPSEMSHHGGLGPLVANFLQHAELSVSVSLHSRRNLTPVPSCLTFAAERFPTWSPQLSPAQRATSARFNL
jgi:hypothetical protein